MMDDWLRKLLYSGYTPEPHSQFGRDALAPLGGFDPRAMENGTPDFNTVGAKADLFGAKAIGALTNPKTAGLLGMGLLGASQGRPQAPAHIPSNPFPQFVDDGRALANMQELYALRRKRRPRIDADKE